MANAIYNRVLNTLSSRTLKKIGRQLEPVDLPLRKVLHDTDEPVDYVYFPTDGIVSMVNEPVPGEVVEIATVGNEGAVGLPVLLGANSMPSRSIVQVAGKGMRWRTAAFRKFVDSDDKFRDLLLRYTLALVNQIAQSASCNRLHEVHQRCARWLLQTQDRMASDTFALTHEFLAQMLGVHRPTVSVAAGMLQQNGLIDYSRGKITVLDRKALEKASCPCYRLISREYERLLGD